MTKPTTLASIMGSLFGRSEKAISEKLSTEEHEGFAADVSELNEKLEAQIADNGKISGELATAAARIIELEASLLTAQGESATLTTSLTAVTADRDKYKAHYDLAGSKGDKDGNQDHNSRGNTGKSGYNENAMSVWQKANA